MPFQFGVPEEIVDQVCTGRLFPEAYSPYLSELHDRHVIGINDAYLIGDWLDFVFFGDGSWYLKNRKRLARWGGLKVTCHARFANKPPEDMEGIKVLLKDSKKRHGISDNPRLICWNGNSGAAAISMAANLGAKVIFLLGFDMKSSKFTHWHGGHLKKGKKPPYKRHLTGFPQIAKDAGRRGITILNVNTGSKIDSFPKVTLREALDYGKSPV